MLWRPRFSFPRFGENSRNAILCEPIAKFQLAKHCHLGRRAGNIKGIFHIQGVRYQSIKGFSFPENHRPLGNHLS